MNDLKARVRHALIGLSPDIAGGVLAARSRRLCQRVEKRHGLPALSERLVAEFGSAVLGGPFHGLILPEAMYRRHVGPFLAGTYESALHPFIEGLRSRPYRLIVDVGSSFGYYAVGLARMYPLARVVAYDTDRWARKATRRTAELNGCRNVEVRAACSPAALARAAEERCLVMSDCEGYEKDLFLSLPPDRLRVADLVIEVHPPGDAAVLCSLREHFAATHASRVVAHGATPNHGSPPKEAVAEWRHPAQHWLLLSPL